MSLISYMALILLLFDILFNILSCRTNFRQKSGKMNKTGYNAHELAISSSFFIQHYDVLLCSSESRWWTHQKELRFFRKCCEQVCQPEDGEQLLPGEPGSLGHPSLHPRLPHYSRQPGPYPQPTNIFNLVFIACELVMFDA